VSVGDLYSPRIGLHISSSRIGRPIVGIYKSLTNAWMWKLGLRPRYSFSGSICFEIWVFCLCSVSRLCLKKISACLRHKAGNNGWKAFYLPTVHSLALMNLKTLRTLTFLFRYHGVSLACNMIRLFCCLLLTETEDGNLILGIERRGGTP